MSARTTSVCRSASAPKRPLEKGPIAIVSPIYDKTLLEYVASEVNLREGAPGVAAFLRAVTLNEGVPLKEIAREIGLPIPVATAVRRELEARGLLARDSGVSLTEAGRAFSAEVLDLQAASVVLCSACDGTGLAAPDSALVERLYAIIKSAPGVKVELDQAPCTPETALRRAALMHKAGALEGRKILLLGDDDSLSLAIPLYLAAQGRTDPVDNITLLEIDEARMSFLREQTAALGAEVSIVPHDLRDPLPGHIRGSFDTFQTDPPYTVEGAQLFLTRAVEGLRSGPGALGYLSYGQPATADQFALLSAIQSLGFAVTAMHRDFNTYEGASILGSIGQMIELEGLFAEPVRQPERHSGILYTAEKATRKRSYRCKGCGTRVSLGERGGPNTIEALKSAGCPSCGAAVFSRWTHGGGKHRRR